MVSSRREVSISWIFLRRVIFSFGEGWKDSLLMVIPSYVSKFKKFLSSSIIQQLHGLSFDSPFGMFARKSSYEVKSCMDGEVEMEKVWTFKFLATEALKYQS